MKFDIVLTGVGGEGVLTSQVMIARAANLEGYHVRGIQLHGLAQRGGVIPTFVRLSSEKIYSPDIMQANADLVIAFEPLEALRAIHYARKKKTVFIINDYPVVPIYANIFDIPYPNMSKIVKKIKPFAERIHVFEASNLGRGKFGSVIFGNTILLGAAVGASLLPLSDNSLREAIKVTAREAEKNVEAFDLGLKLGREKSFRD